MIFFVFLSRKKLFSLSKNFEKGRNKHCISKTAMPKLLLKFFFVFFLCLGSFIVKGQLTASFTASDTAGCAPMIVHFTNTSTGATSYSWDLGNGTITSIANPSASYSSAGTYTVTLTASNSGSSVTYSLIIIAYKTPSVSFSANDSIVCKGMPITFTSTSISNAWGPLAYTWNFGDGNSSNANSPVYSYPTAGSYNITLFAKNKPGCISSLGKSGYITVNASSTAGFKSLTTFFCTAPATAAFTNTTTGTGPYSYLWSFGDGGTSTATNPTHTYITSGPNTVKLNVKDGNGCTDSLVQYSYITLGSLSAQFSSVSRGCLTPVNFTNTSSTHITSQWYFGDGGSSTDENPVYTYAASGYYTVKLIIFDGLCYDSITHPITISAPTGSFSVSQPCTPASTLTFTGTTAPGNTIMWHFGDLNSAPGPTVTHTYHPPSVIALPPYPTNPPLIYTIDMVITDGSGCTSTIEQVDTIKDPFLVLTTDHSLGCIPQTCSFTSDAEYEIDLFITTPTFPYPHGISSYSWDFGDGSPVSTLPNPSHTYTAVNYYTVQCTAVTSNGCTIRTALPRIEIGSLQVPSFTRTPTIICAGQSVSFTSTSTNLSLIDGYDWSYGDGGGDNTPTTKHKFTSPDTFNVGLKVWSHGCESKPFYLKDTVKPSGADFIFTYTCIPDNGVSFTDYYLNGDDTRIWDFGDGTTSTLTNPVHYFPAQTKYTVQLSTSNTTTGCRDTSKTPVFLQRLSPVLTPIHTYICKDIVDTVDAKINCVMDGGAPVIMATKSKWYINGSFIDSTIPYNPIPMSPPSILYDSFSHAIHTTSVNTVTIIVTDNHGCLDTGTTNISVPDPKANFSFTVTAGCPPLVATFTDHSTDISGAYISDYLWNFGDTTRPPRSSPTVVHTYTTGGVFTITETITDNVGCFDTYTSSSHITVYKPIAAFSASSTYLCLGSSTGFNNYSIGGSKYLWVFGDGTTSTLALPAHSYTTTGLYTVKLIVTDIMGCTDTSILPNYITVNPVPAASFVMSDSFAVCPPLNVNFTNTSIGSTSSHWSFGDGTYSLTTSPNAIYLTRKLYTIKLVAVNSYGCIDSAIGHASIFGYSGAFSYTPLSVCTPLPVHFKASLSGVTNIEWDFNDGIISNTSLFDTISHSYLTVGSYVPKLILTDSSGCLSISTGADTIKVDTLIPGFTILSYPACQNSGITFIDSSFSHYSSDKSWLWTFGPGATSTADTATYTYSTAGTQAVTLSVTNGNGCKGTITKNITVNAGPAAITGSPGICIGLPDILSDATSGGTWSSSNTSIATVGTGTGIVNGIIPDTVVIAYTISDGCKSTITATVNSMPAAITGTTAVCTGLTTKLSDATAGGTWISSNIAIATIGSKNAVVTGIAGGTATISYQLPSGCAATTIIKVDSSPVAISGPSTICIGTTITLSDAIAGGSWYSSNTGIATINITSGDLTGLSTGVFTIDYSMGSGCGATKTVTATPAPSAISGPDSLCAGATITLSDPSPGGKWSSSNIAIAPVITGSGLVSGFAAGTVTISYTISSGCAATIPVTVNPIPSLISGTSNICLGQPTPLSDADAGGTWNSSVSTVATINPTTGIINGVSVGTTTITYTLATGCKITAPATVKIAPSAITGTTIICAGSATALSDLIPFGTWSSNNNAIASVGTGSGLVSGITAGTATISYMLGNSCMVTTAITVDSLPSPITGAFHLCNGLSDTLTDPGGGTWGSGNPTIATIGAITGIVKGLSPGTSTITYTIATGCNRTITLTVNPLPSPITGASNVCAGYTIPLSDADAGGIWNADSITIATVSPGKGIVTGISGGTATITYTLPTGCITTKITTVNPVPAAITGKATVCVSVPTQFSDTTPGGSWNSADLTVAIGTGSGIVTGVSPGTATISFTLATGCMATKQVTVAPLPAPITGNKNICSGLTTTLSDASSGGIWSSTDTTVIVAAGTGLISGKTLGSATITYTLSTGCYETTTATVSPEPAPITGIKDVCEGKTTALSDSIGAPGNWNSSSTAIASVNNSGIVTGVSGGTTTITYSTNAGCTAATTVTVYPLIPPINGKTSVCKGKTTTLINAVNGGTWSSSNSAVASIDASGVVTGIATGTTTISYFALNSCDTATAKVIVDPLPDAGTIKGKTNLCAGSTELLSDNATGGVWTSGNNSIAGINASGLVTGLATGITTISYTYTNSCGTDKTGIAVTVNATPARAHITTHPGLQLCTNSLFQNFGADTTEPAGAHYIWSAANAIVYAVSQNRQYCLINFNSAGTNMVTLATEALATDCSSYDTLVFNIGPGESPNPVVVYYAPEFVCKDNTAGSYQWGYDDAVTLDSTLLPGMVNQNYYNQNPDFLKKYYWVMTYHNGCLQKSYYNAPTGIAGVSDNNMEILLFPNPAGQEINMEVKGMNRPDNIDATLYDILGKERKTTVIENGAGSFGLSGLPPGVYMIMLSRNGERLGSRVFVKN